MMWSYGYDALTKSGVMDTSDTQNHLWYTDTCLLLVYGGLCESHRD